MARSDDLFDLTRRLYVRREKRLRPLHWQPPADVYRVERGWLVKFELAGVQEEHISVLLHGRLLLLRGSRYDLDWQEGCESHVMEIAYSRFERAVELPEPVGAARIETLYRRGMLLVHVITEEGET